MHDQDMRRLLLASFLIVASYASATPVAERYRLPIIDQKVDPAVFPKDAQVKEPDVVSAPAVVYPWESHSGFAAEVALYIKINDFGYPTRIAVFSSSSQVFERSAVANAMQTRWQVDSRSKLPTDAWFAYVVKVVRRD
jgi:hypothetical protein